MEEFIDWISFVNHQMHTRELPRLESMLMPANFSSIVGEFMTATIPKHSPGVEKNTYHNGYPDLLAAGMFPGDSAQHVNQGIEVKGARYPKGWQGHNPEDILLLVFCFDSNRPVDASKNIVPKPFRFIKVVRAHLEKTDWLFAGRSETSRRTITASVTDSGYQKMQANWIYSAPADSLAGSPTAAEVEHPEVAAVE